MTIEMWLDSCSNLGYLYAGLQFRYLSNNINIRLTKSRLTNHLIFSSFCYCGNSFGKYGKSDLCQMKCSGDSNQLCGGYTLNSIYEKSK